MFSVFNVDLQDSLDLEVPVVPVAALYCFVKRQGCQGKAQFDSKRPQGLYASLWWPQRMVLLQSAIIYYATTFAVCRPSLQTLMQVRMHA